MRAAKRREARKQEQAKKKAEQAEAVMFMAFCKQYKLRFGKDENRRYEMAYDWLKPEFEKWKQGTQAT